MFLLLVPALDKVWPWKCMKLCFHRHWTTVVKFEKIGCLYMWFQLKVSEKMFLKLRPCFDKVWPERYMDISWCFIINFYIKFEKNWLFRFVISIKKHKIIFFSSWHWPWWNTALKIYEYCITIDNEYMCNVWGKWVWRNWLKFDGCIWRSRWNKISNAKIQ